MSSPRAKEYRELIDDVIAGGLLEEDEWVEIKDLISRVVAKIEANMPPKPAIDQAAE